MSDLQTVQAALDKVTDQLREHAARATSDREVQAKHKESVDQLLAKQSELQAELQAMAQTVDKIGRGADATAKAARTPGEVFTSADGFEAFTEAGNAFDAQVAERLRRFVYASGNSIEPGAAYAAFRGHGPQVEPLLRKRGLLEPA